MMFDPVPAILGGLFCGIVGILVVIIGALLGPRYPCPDCGAKLPRFGGSVTWWQFFWDGRCMCAKCQCLFSERRGRIRSGPPPSETSTQSEAINRIPDMLD
jgi:hypothetical protein